MNPVRSRGRLTGNYFTTARIRSLLDYQIINNGRALMDVARHDFAKSDEY